MLPLFKSGQGTRVARGSPAAPDRSGGVTERSYIYYWRLGDSGRGPGRRNALFYVARFHAGARSAAPVTHPCACIITHGPRTDRHRLAGSPGSFEGGRHGGAHAMRFDASPSPPLCRGGGGGGRSRTVHQTQIDAGPRRLMVNLIGVSRKSRSRTRDSATSAPPPAWRRRGPMEIMTAMLDRAKHCGDGRVHQSGSMRDRLNSRQPGFAAWAAEKIRGLPPAGTERAVPARIARTADGTRPPSGWREASGAPPSSDPRGAHRGLWHAVPGRRVGPAGRGRAASSGGHFCTASGKTAWASFQMGRASVPGSRPARLTRPRRIRSGRTITGTSVAGCRADDRVAMSKKTFRLETSNRLPSSRVAHDGKGNYSFISAGRVSAGSTAAVRGPRGRSSPGYSYRRIHSRPAPRFCRYRQAWAWPRSNPDGARPSRIDAGFCKTGAPDGANGQAAAAWMSRRNPGAATADVGAPQQDLVQWLRRPRPAPGIARPWLERSSRSKRREHWPPGVSRGHRVGVAGRANAPRPADFVAGHCRSHPEDSGARPAGRADVLVECGNVVWSYRSLTSLPSAHSAEVGRPYPVRPFIKEVDRNPAKPTFGWRSCPSSSLPIAEIRRTWARVRIDPNDDSRPGPTPPSR